MNRPWAICAIALAEARSLRRMVRTWIVWTLIIAAGFSAVAYGAFNHYVHGYASPSAGAVSPRFLAHGFGAAALCLAFLGSAFLAFDFRVRDEQDGISGSLDTKPISNIELLLGKHLAFFVAAWFPIVVAAVVIQVGGSISGVVWHVGSPFEPVSLLRFVLLDSIPALMLWISIIVLLAVAFVNRLLVVVVSAVLWGVLISYHVHVPLGFLPIVSLLGDVRGLASDILPHLASGTDLVQRVSVLGIAAGVMVVAATIYRRPDAHVRVRRLAGVAILSAGALGIAILAAHAHARSVERHAWAAAHSEIQSQPVADIERLGGQIRIDPGERLTLDIELQLTTSDNETLRELLLSFNPGLDISALTVDGAATTYKHSHGMLVVDLPSPLRSGLAVRLAIQARGVPDPLFAYLDGAVDVQSKPLYLSGLSLLGVESSLFDHRYVALMPAIRWLPAPGPNYGTNRRPRDLHMVDLEVEVPPGWLVAGPGRRETLGGVGSNRFRFAPREPVPAVALLASRFESYQVMVEGVNVEALFNPKHRRNYDLHGEVGPGGFGARAVAEYYLKRAERFGLRYSYGEFSLVEVPAQLRTYGGGWRMDSVVSQPGIVLIREHGFPTAPFGFAYDRAERPNVINRWILYLQPYFGADFSGGNLARAAARNLFSFASCAKGDEAIALEFLLEELACRVVGRQGLNVAAIFSAHLFEESTDSMPARTVINRLLGTTASIHAAAALQETSREAVWNKVSTDPLARLDLDHDPRLALGVLMLKSSATAQAMIDYFGEDATARLLAEVRRDGARRCYEAADVLDTAVATAKGLEHLVRDYLYGQSLPGYLASPPEVFRLADDDLGRPQYQTRLHVRNDEAPVGFVRLSYRGRSPSYFDGRGETVRIGGHTSLDVGVVSNHPPEHLTLKVYLARNRTDLQFALPRPDTNVQIRVDPLRGARPSKWQPDARPEGDVVVDDLDPGFALLAVPAKMDLLPWESLVEDRISELNVGLPAYPARRFAKSMWQRQEAPSGWGKYRRTIARSDAGTGRWAVAFKAALEEGRWRLEYHLPEYVPAAPQRLRFGANYRVRPGSFNFGFFDMKVVAGDVEQTLSFDASEADAGWNHLGDFDIQPGSVSLVVSNRTTGDIVIADAIRWRRLPVETSNIPGIGGLPNIHTMFGHEATSGRNETTIEAELAARGSK